MDTHSGSMDKDVSLQEGGSPRSSVLWGSYLRKHAMFLVFAVLACLMSIYWLLIASDRYVSEAHLVVQRTDIAGPSSMDFAGLLSGGSGTGRGDQLVLQDYLLSNHVLKKLDAALGLSASYSDTRNDVFSRLWGQSHSIEDLQAYFKRRIQINYDEYAGVLVIKAEAFDPVTAQAIVEAMVSMGEAYMNASAQSLAQSQIGFLELEVAKYHQQVLNAQQAIVAFQNEHGVVSPAGTVEQVMAIIATLEGQRSELQAKRTELQSYLVSDHPSILMLSQQIAAIQNQIKKEQSSLTTPQGGALNATTEAFLRLEAEAKFAETVYTNALVALEKSKLEASRIIKKISIVQPASLPESAIEPRRWYNAVVWVLGLGLCLGLVFLMTSIVRDHKV